MWTCGVGPLGGGGSGVLGANASSLQQSLQGAVLPGRGHAAEPLGTAQGVHAARLPLGQNRRAAGDVGVPRGPTRPQRILAGGTDLEGTPAASPGPRSTVGDQQQRNSRQVRKERHLPSRSQVLHTVAPCQLNVADAISGCISLLSFSCVLFLLLQQ